MDVKCRLFNWVTDFLDKRSIRVCINGAESNSCVVKNGTLHGRVFNPLFILIMIKHIFDQIPKHIQIAAFADDTVIRKRGRSADY